MSCTRLCSCAWLAGWLNMSSCAAELSSAMLSAKVCHSRSSCAHSSHGRVRWLSAAGKHISIACSPLLISPRRADASRCKPLAAVIGSSRLPYGAAVRKVYCNTAVLCLCTIAACCASHHQQNGASQASNSGSEVWMLAANGCSLHAVFCVGRPHEHSDDLTLAAHAAAAYASDVRLSLYACSLLTRKARLSAAIICFASAPFQWTEAGLPTAVTHTAPHWQMRLVLCECCCGVLEASFCEPMSAVCCGHSDQVCLLCTQLLCAQQPDVVASHCNLLVQVPL